MSSSIRDCCVDLELRLTQSIEAVFCRESRELLREIPESFSTSVNIFCQDGSAILGSIFLGFNRLFLEEYALHVLETSGSDLTYDHLVDAALGFTTSFARASKVCMPSSTLGLPEVLPDRRFWLGVNSPEHACVSRRAVGLKQVEVHVLWEDFQRPVAVTELRSTRRFSR